MSISDLALLDSNILVYNHQALSKFHAESRNLVEKVKHGQIAACLCPQVLTELFAVITNPKRVTSPVDADEALEEVEKFLKVKNLTMIYAACDTLEITLELVKRHGTRGSEIFDVQLVATMLSNDITSIYTYNKSDFLKFKEIEVLSP